ncbi:MAG TPA: hypothetical protein VME18_08645 [Acidobacteriaceae bacterium]|nr:hypothetical protein [Acidobacteriaceae bacterium]
MKEILDVGDPRNWWRGDAIIVITRHGKPVAQIGPPVTAPNRRARLGGMEGPIRFAPGWDAHVDPDKLTHLSNWRLFLWSCAPNPSEVFSSCRQSIAIPSIGCGLRRRLPKTCSSSRRTP